MTGKALNFCWIHNAREGTLGENQYIRYVEIRQNNQFDVRIQDLDSKVKFPRVPVEKITF